MEDQGLNRPPSNSSSGKQSSASSTSIRDRLTSMISPDMWAEREQLYAEREQLYAEREQLCVTVTDMRAEVQVLNGVIDEICTGMAKLCATINEMRENQEVLKHEIEDIRKSHERTTQELEVARHELETARSSVRHSSVGNAISSTVRSAKPKPEWKIPGTKRVC